VDVGRHNGHGQYDAASGITLKFACVSPGCVFPPLSANCFAILTRTPVRLDATDDSSQTEVEHLPVLATILDWLVLHHPRWRAN